MHTTAHSCSAIADDPRGTDEIADQIENSDFGIQNEALPCVTALCNGHTLPSII